MIDRRLFLGLFGAAMSCAPQAHGQIRSSPRAAALIAAARKQVGVTLNYDPSYTVLPFPGGDVPRVKGVCTDVVIRAYRDAFGIDLQALVNADMKRNFAAYPKRWGLKTTDRNIDHRRVPNLQVFLARMGAKRALTSSPADWQPGDIFTCLVNRTLPHIGIVSDQKTLTGRPLIIHNIGNGAREEDGLFAYQLTGHYRWQLD